MQLFLHLRYSVAQLLRHVISGAEDIDGNRMGVPEEDSIEDEHVDVWVDETDCELVDDCGDESDGDDEEEEVVVVEGEGAIGDDEEEVEGTLGDDEEVVEGTLGDDEEEAEGTLGDDEEEAEGTLGDDEVDGSVPPPSVLAT